MGSQILLVQATEATPSSACYCVVRRPRDSEVYLAVLGEVRAGVNALTIRGPSFCWKRLRRRRLLARHVRLRHRPLFDRKDRLAGRAIEQVEHRLLAHRRDRLHRPAVDGEVDEHRRRGDVHVPDRMVHELEMPLPLAGLVVDRDDALGEQVVAGTEAAVEVRARRLDRQVREPELLVDRHLIPDADVAVDRPRIVQPGVVAELAGPRNRVERPQPLAGAHVEAADQPFGVVVRLRRAAFEERRADQHDAVAGDGRRRRAGRSPRSTRSICCPLPNDHAFLQIDDAVLAERRRCATPVFASSATS